MNYRHLVGSTDAVRRTNVAFLSGEDKGVVDSVTLQKYADNRLMTCWAMARSDAVSQSWRQLGLVE